MWMFYDADTGIFNGNRYSGPNVSAQVPVGHAAIEGRYDPLSQRVNTITGEVEDYIPDAPADTDRATYAWDSGSKRWIATPTLEANRLARKAPVQAAIDALEANDSHQRSLREVVLALLSGETPPPESVSALSAVDAAIAPLRATIGAIDAAATQAALDAVTAPEG